MKYLFKITIIPFVYLVLMDVISFCIMALQKDLKILCLVLLIMLVALFCVILTMILYREGQQALRVRTANDLERENIIRTGEDRKLKLSEEYKLWKGFVVGLIIVAPLLILLLLHTILVFGVSESLGGAGTIGCVLYYVFYGFYLLLEIPVNIYAAYSTLIAVPIIVIITGLSYYLGAKNIMKFNKELDEAHNKMVNGD